MTSRIKLHLSLTSSAWKKRKLSIRQAVKTKRDRERVRERKIRKTRERERVCESPSEREEKLERESV